MDTITKPASKFRKKIVRKFPTVTGIGVFNCRKILGSDSWSQHAWGNALDIFGPRHTLARLAGWATGRFISRVWKVQTVIWQKQIWSYDWHRWEPYDGVAHTTHVHVDFRPRKTGVPPCAQ